MICYNDELAIITPNFQPIIKIQVYRLRSIYNKDLESQGTHHQYSTIAEPFDSPQTSFIMPSLIALSMVVGTIATPVLADIYNVNVPSGFFSGAQSGIGSWYRASTGQDSTNGQSWCGYKYYNSDPVFAPVS